MKDLEIKFNKKLLTEEGLGERGMTLIEILAVVVLLGLILGVVAKGIFGQSDAAQAKLNVVKMERLQSAISQYRLEFGKYPPSLNALVKADAEIKDSGKVFVPLVQEDELKDIWGGDYIYQRQGTGQGYSLTSLGADGVQGGEGADQDVTKKP